MSGPSSPLPWGESVPAGREMNTPRTCRLLTLGCKVNQYETQYVRELLECNGYVSAGADQPADLCVLNTCTVTAEGDAKSRQLVRRLHQANPHATIVVMGCYATRDPQTSQGLAGRHPCHSRQGATRRGAGTVWRHTSAARHLPL